MNILILGPGAIGSLWGIKLQQAGHRVAVWMRNTHPIYNVKLDQSPSISFTNRGVNDVTNADLILVTVKAWQVSAALTSILPHIHPETIFLFMHNGMGALDEISPWLSDQPILMATTTHGVLKHGALKHYQEDGLPLAPIQMTHSGQGQTLVGAANEKGRQCTFLVNVLNHALPHVHWHPHIHEALWYKLAINCTINPLTALNQCPNGELSKPDYKLIKALLIEETTAVMQAEGIPVGQNQLAMQIDHVIQITQQNRSSMCQDVFYQRKTEIDYITGYLLHVAQDHQILIPHNEKLYHQIKALEKEWENS